MQSHRQGKGPKTGAFLPRCKRKEARGGLVSQGAPSPEGEPRGAPRAQSLIEAWRSVRPAVSTPSPRPCRVPPVSPVPALGAHHPSPLRLRGVASPHSWIPLAPNVICSPGNFAA